MSSICIYENLLRQSLTFLAVPQHFVIFWQPRVVWLFDQVVNRIEIELNGILDNDH